MPSINPYFSDMPCGVNDRDFPDATSKKFSALQRSLVRVPAGPSAELIQAFLQSYRLLYCNLPATDKKAYLPNLALGALFDLVVSANYAERLVSDGGWTYCAGAGMQETPSLYFCYLKTCPRCSVNLGIKPRTLSNKPKSEVIGDICGDATCQILSELVRVNAPAVKIGKSGDRMGDVDFVLYDQNALVLGETKSSPLVIYPLESTISHILKEVREGERAPKKDHTAATINLDSADIAMYLPHISERIPLGAATSEGWPYAGLIQYVQSDRNVAMLISAWKDLYGVYEENLLRGSTDSRKWITCGCGGGVDDSKNKPGLDRTDDIKKGTYQSLKFGTYFKEKAPRRNVLSVIASNFFPLRTFDRYLSEMTDVVWTKEKYAQTVQNMRDPDVLLFARKDLFNLYDAIICFTSSIYRDERLREIASLDDYAEKLCQ